MIHRDYKELYKNLRIDCKNCLGFCCVALYFSSSEGFPNNKDAGKPCVNLQNDFSCAIHKDLRKKGLKGCTSYDCFGAGQKVAQVTYKDNSWMKTPELSNEMFDVFLIMRQLHEMLWYLTDSLRVQANGPTKDEINNMIIKTEDLTNLSADAILLIDIDAHRTAVNKLLSQTSNLVRNKAGNMKNSPKKNMKTIAGRKNFIGADLRKTNLCGADLRGALLIASNVSKSDLSFADLIGADMRDADFRGANLKDSIFITQSQVNVMKGDDTTKLPEAIERPKYWV